MQCVDELRQKLLLIERLITRYQRQVARKNLTLKKQKVPEPQWAMMEQVAEQGKAGKC